MHKTEVCLTLNSRIQKENGNSSYKVGRGVGSKLASLDGMESSWEEESYFPNKNQGDGFKIKVRSSPSPTQSLQQLPT